MTKPIWHEEIRKSLATTSAKVSDFAKSERECKKQWRPAFRAVAEHLRDLVGYAEDALAEGNRLEASYILAIIEGGVILLDGLVHTPGDPKIQFLASFTDPEQAQNE